MSGNLEIAEPVYLGMREEIDRYCFQRLIFTKFIFNAYNIPELEKKPFINFCKFMYSFNRHPYFKSFSNWKDPHICRVGKVLLNILKAKIPVSCKAVHTLTNHSQSFLDNLFKQIGRAS